MRLRRKPVWFFFVVVSVFANSQAVGKSGRFLGWRTVPGLCVGASLGISFIKKKERNKIKNKKIKKKVVWHWL